MIAGYYLGNGFLMIAWVADWVVNNPLYGIPAAILAILLVSVFGALVEVL